MRPGGLPPRWPGTTQGCVSPYFSVLPTTVSSAGFLISSLWISVYCVPVGPTLIAENAHMSTELYSGWQSTGTWAHPISNS